MLTSSWGWMGRRGSWEVRAKNVRGEAKSPKRFESHSICPDKASRHSYYPRKIIEADYHISDKGKGSILYWVGEYSGKSLLYFIKKCKMDNIIVLNNRLFMLDGSQLTCLECLRIFWNTNGVF